MSAHRIAWIAVALSLLSWCGLPHAAAEAPKADTRQLEAAVQKLNGYWRTEKTDAKPVLVIQFRSPGPGDNDLKGLRPLLAASPAAVGLNLNQCYNVSDVGVEHLAGITTLHSLSLGNTKVSDAGLKHLSGLTGLEELYLADDKLTNAGLAHLSKLTSLRKLSVFSKGVTDAGYKHLAGMTKLEEIHVGDIGHSPGDACLAHMKGMTQLRKLGTSRDKLTDAGMAHIRNFTELRELRLEAEKVTADGLKNLAPLKKVTRLTVMSCPAINGEAMAAVGGMTGLEELEIIYCGALKPEAAAHLNRLTNLKKLRFDSVHDAALQGIAGLTKLEDLRLYYAGVGDAGLKHLGALKGLRELSLSNNPVTDAGLEHLAGLSNLRELNLASTQVTGNGLKHLAGLTNLKTLYVSDCKIAGPGLEHLKGLTGLQDLSLGGNPLTDAGLEPLKSLTDLTSLNLTGTKVNDEAVLALKKALPRARIRDVAGDEVTLEKPKPRPKPAVEDLSKTPPDFQLTADELFKEYKADRGAAEKKYRGKVIELSGVVDGMGSNISDDSYLSLKVDKELIGVMCFTADDAPWNVAVPGQKVKIKGKWPEFSVSAALVASVLTETGPSPAVRLTADELAKEYKADREAAEKKYKEQYLIVTGEVIDRELNSVGAASVQLKAAGEVKVKCSFTAFAKSQAKALKVGQTVTLIGQYTLNFGGQEVGLYFCQTLRPPKK
ncbi:MAG TPA: leucine-rich repeat domain-containing protein [Gemmataceae bacterium]|nr:leucine-rich repeat domain-containing protein [Gemmataceae bacterium]